MRPESTGRAPPARPRTATRRRQAQEAWRITTALACLCASCLGWLGCQPPAAPAGGEAQTPAAASEAEGQGGLAAAPPRGDGGRKGRGRGRSRTHAAAVVIRFHHGAEPGQQGSEVHDRLRVAAAFADVERDDAAIVEALVGASAASGSLALDSCLQRPTAQAAAMTAPRDLVQLLDVGDLVVHAGDGRLPLEVSLVPHLSGAVRGVRYDGTLARARGLLGHGKLSISADGGDGVAPFSAAIVVPRPLRLTHVGGRAVRGAIAEVVLDGRGLELRWGSIDPQAELWLRLAPQDGAAPTEVRCRLRDDGQFELPAGPVAAWPQATQARWVLQLERHVRAPIPGFAGQTLALELRDAVVLQAAGPEVVPPNGQPRPTSRRQGHSETARPPPRPLR